MMLLERRRRRHADDQPPAGAAAQPPAAVVQRTGFPWGIPEGGLDENEGQIGASTQTDRSTLLQELYDAYIACPWAWACVQAIARTITAGGLVTEWDPDTADHDPEAPPKPPAVLALERLIAFTNPQQDIRQLLRNVVADLLVFGDAYIEVVWWGATPVALYNQDSPTTTPITDSHGNVSRYVQVTDYGAKAEFRPEQIIHFSLDSARPGAYGVSPMQAALGPVTAWLFAHSTGKESFRKGLPPNFHADFPSSADEPTMRRWRDQYRVQNLGPKNIGTPVITKGGVHLAELQPGKIADIQNAKDQARGEILAIFGVPPSKVTVIESGNLGGGTGEAQDKTYRLDTCQPIGEIVLEKLNYALTTRAFGITDWHLRFPDVDYRDSQTVEQIRDTRLRNGAWTRNRYAAEIGEPPVPGGDEPVLVDRQNLVLWKDMPAMSRAMVAAKAASAGAVPGSVPGVPAVPAIGKPAGQGQGNCESGPAAHAAVFAAALAAARRYQVPALAATAPVTERQRDPKKAALAQLSKDFPPKAIKWARNAEWEGPMPVPMHDIDTSNRASWAASHDPGKVAKLRRRLRRRMAAGGHPKPAILVRTPGSSKDVIADGHHHYEAAEAEGVPTLWAFVARVGAGTGGWDEMHTMQKGGNR